MEDLIFSLKKQFESDFPDDMRIENIFEILASAVYLKDEKELSDKLRNLGNYFHERIK